MSFPLPTRDPSSGRPLVVTRLECPQTGTVVEGRFDLGWIGRLTPEQLTFAGQLLARRGNLQRLASDLDIAYNTARARLDDIVVSLGADPGVGVDAVDALERLSAGEVSVDEVIDLLGS